MSTVDSSLIKSIEKAKSDTFDCLIKILPNGIKALLISDSDLDKSSAALAVNVGSLTDSPNELGLAHFCEHLLFLGTEKYPSENEFDDYLSKNGGDSNAYTGLDKTVYYFNVDSNAFEGAIDRFSQFFISSKFSEGSVEREINAINSEFSKNKNSDTWRFYQLFKSQLNPKSPFSQFSTGNLETLSYPDIRQRLLKMYNKYYSSEIMALCLYSNMPLAQQINLVEKLFKDVPKRENLEMPVYDIVKPYDESYLSYFYKVVPVEDKDQLSFKWLFPFCENYKAKPLKFFSSLFGHEGPNTLTACLKRENFITDLVSSAEDYAKTFSEFSIDLTLTKKGFDNYKEVILIVLKYINIIKSKEINDRYFIEVKNMRQIDFDYRNKKKADDFTQKYAEYLTLYKPEDVFVGNYLFKEYNKELIRKYLDMFNLDNLIICYVSKSFEKECNLTEKFYGTKYSKEKLTIKKEDIDNFKYDKHIFDYPPENKFLPKNLELFPIPQSEGVQKYPQLILDKENCKAFFLQDTEFKLPRGMIKFRINFVKNLCNNSEIKNEIIAKLLKKIIKLELNEILYLAEECKVKFKLKIYYDKLELMIKGFNDSLKRGLNEFLNLIQNLELTPEKHKEMFLLQKEEYLKKLKNSFLKQSYEVVIEHMKILLTNGFDNKNDLIECLSNEEISLDDLINFKKRMFIDTNSYWLIQGNFQKETALEIINSANSIFKINVDKKVAKSFYAKRVVQLNPNINYIYRFLHPNESEQDSSILSIYQFGPIEKEEKQYFNLLFYFLKIKFYDTLRTKETLGYAVFMSKFCCLDIEHFIGLIQSQVKSPEFCSERIRNFFKEKEKDIKNITDEDFNSHIKSLLVQETKKDIKLKEQFNRNWDEIAIKRYKFNIREENAEFIKKCTKEGFIRFFENFKKNLKKIDMEYVCQKHWEENEKILKEEINDCESIKKRIVFDKISDFQDCNSLYPSPYSNFYNDVNDN